MRTLGAPVAGCDDTSSEKHYLDDCLLRMEIVYHEGAEFPWQFWFRFTPRSFVSNTKRLHPQAVVVTPPDSAQKVPDFSCGQDPTCISLHQLLGARADSFQQYRRGSAHSGNGGARIWDGRAIMAMDWCDVVDDPKLGVYFSCAREFSALSQAQDFFDELKEAASQATLGWQNWGEDFRFMEDSALWYYGPDRSHYVIDLRLTKASIGGNKPDVELTVHERAEEFKTAP